MMRRKVFAAALLFALCLLAASPVLAAPYLGQVSHDVKRDRIIAISEDYVSIRWYNLPANIDYTNRPGATCPDPTLGLKTAMKYCWGGADSPLQYLDKMATGWGAGNKNTGSSSSYDTYTGGADCSGMASSVWTSPRKATSSFESMAVRVDWEDLRMGDATNFAGSHIRIYDYYVSNSGTIMFYETAAASGQWRTLHRALARDNDYIPIRYKNPTGYKVYDFPEPVITYVKTTGVERVEVRWDGQASVGFRLYRSLDGANWEMIRDTADLTPPMRVCEVSGLLPDVNYYLRMTSVNATGETAPSQVATFRLSAAGPAVLVVDGADRYREQFAAHHTFMTRVGSALGKCGMGFDFCANESVVDGAIDLAKYPSVFWTLAEESTFDETFSWPEQSRVTKYLSGGGRLFVSGSEIGWDLDQAANSSTYKNGHPNDSAFYNKYLRSDYVSDDANTYQVTGIAGTPFANLTFSFDDGTHGTYNVQTPDVISALGAAQAGLNYSGGAGGAACVFDSSPSSGTVVSLAFGFETIYPESARDAMADAVFNYLNVPAQAPTLKSATQDSSGKVTVCWDGQGSLGFRLLQKTGAGSWAQVLDESALGPETRTVTLDNAAMDSASAFKVRSVSGAGASVDSDSLCASPSLAGQKILVVDGYDRWNSQSGGSNNALVERVSEALAANGARFDSCANEAVVEGAVALSNYSIVVWMCGEESTESETFSAAEQSLVSAFLDQGGRIFVSGAEIGWDLVQKGGALNDFSNGSAGDTQFFNQYLKAIFARDDSGTYAVRGATGSIFDGLNFSFDDGTHGSYNADYPDVIAPTGSSAQCLYYGAGSDVAGVVFSGSFAKDALAGKLVYFGFPFETINDASVRADVIGRILVFFDYSSAENPANSWWAY